MNQNFVKIEGHNVNRLVTSLIVAPPIVLTLLLFAMKLVRQNPQS